MHGQKPINIRWDDALHIVVIINSLRALGNGLLHDGFVLAEHKGGYDSE